MISQVLLIQYWSYLLMKVVTMITLLFSNYSLPQTPSALFRLVVTRPLATDKQYLPEVGHRVYRANITEGTLLRVVFFSLLLSELSQGTT